MVLKSRLTLNYNYSRNKKDCYSTGRLTWGKNSTRPGIGNKHFFEVGLSV